MDSTALSAAINLAIFVEALKDAKEAVKKAGEAGDVTKEIEAKQAQIAAQGVKEEEWENRFKERDAPEIAAFEADYQAYRKEQQEQADSALLGGGKLSAAEDYLRMGTTNFQDRDLTEDEWKEVGDENGRGAGIGRNGEVSGAA